MHDELLQWEDDGGYADQHAHNVMWMTAKERDDYGRKLAEIDRKVRGMLQ